MAQTDPWTLARDYLAMLNDAAARDARFAYGMRENIGQSQIARQDAATLAGVQAERADISFGRDLFRDQARREHDIGLKRMELAGKGAGTRLRPGGGGGGRTVAPGGGAGDVATYAYNRYVSQGINPIVASAIVGNLDAESSWNPDVISGGTRGDAGSAAYIAQWRGSRQANLIMFAQQRGHDSPTLDDQLDFIIYEGESGQDAGARQALMLAAQSKTPEEAAEHFMRHYERPKDDPRTNQVDRRRAAAAAIYAGGTTSGTDTITTAAADPYSISEGGARRHVVDPYAIEPDVPPANVVPGTASFDPSKVDRNYIWTEEDKKSFFDAAEIGMLPPDMDIVGPGAFYTGEQLNALGPGAQYLHPVGSPEPGQPSGYLHMAPRTAPANAPAPTQQPSQTIGPPVEVQQLPTPGAPTETPGINAPATAPSTSFPGVGPTGGQRVRQDPATGQYLMFDGSQWIPLSG